MDAGDLCNHTRPCTQKALFLIQCSTITTLQFLIILPLNLYFLSSVCWDNRECIWAEEMLGVCVCNVCVLLRFLLPDGIHAAPWAQSSGRLNNEWLFNKIQNECQVSVLSLWLSKQAAQTDCNSIWTRTCFKHKKKTIFLRNVKF